MVRNRIRKLSVLCGLVLLLGTSGIGLAKAPVEQALKDYGAAMHELGNILSSIRDPGSAQQAVPHLNAQIDKIQALKPHLVTPQGEEPSKDDATKGRLKKLQKLSQELQQTSDRMSKEIQRVLKVRELAEIVGPPLGRLGQE